MNKNCPLIILQLRLLYGPDAAGKLATAGLPAENYFGTRLLTRVISLELSQPRLLATGIRSGGELNAAWFMFKTERADEAVKVLESVLEKLNLLPFATIHSVDNEESPARQLRSSFGDGGGTVLTDEQLSDFLQASSQALMERGQKLAALETEAGKQDKL